MCLLSTYIGCVRPLPISGVALPLFVVDIIAAGVKVREIIVLLHGI